MRQNTFLLGYYVFNKPTTKLLNCLDYIAHLVQKREGGNL